MIDFIERSRENLDFMIGIRRDLHMHPEYDRDLQYTSGLVEKCLKSLEVKYIRFSNNGIMAEIGHARPGCKTIALRADMDALKIDDLKNVSYKSQNKGIMHACGHDAHTAIQIGTIRLLKEIENQLPGKVRFIFQPAEETDGGARDMMEFGCLDGVDAIAGLHVDETLDTGIIGIKRGVVAAASNPFEINIYSKGAHGAQPETGIDGIVIAANMINSLQNVVSREISPLNSAVVTIGKINGGTALNAICSSVKLEGILRSLGNDLREFCKNRIKCIVENTALMNRGRAEIHFVEGYPSFSNDDMLYNSFRDMISDEGDIKLVELDRPGMWVEDFAYYTQRVPGIFYKLGCRNISRGINNPAHGSYFDVDEDCMYFGCAVQSAFAMKLLKE